MRKMARALRAFVHNPYTNLIMGGFIIWSSACEILRELAREAEMRMGSPQGLFALGVLHVLRTLPELFEAARTESEGLEELDAHRSGPEDGSPRR